MLDEVRYRRVVGHAKRRGVSVAAVVRQALDGFFGEDDDSRAAAARTILAAEKMPLPDPGSLKEEIRQTRDRRA